MVDRTRSAQGAISRPGLSDETLETSRLLVEFLHAAYAARHESMAGSQAEPEPIAAEPEMPPPEPISEHAVRAAIHVYQHGDRTVGQIASGLGISYGWASRVVEELERAHYASRTRDLEDRRVVHVRLDPGAERLVERAYHWHGEAVQAALAPLTAAEREAVHGFLGRLTEQLNARRAGRP
jgi:DNA-binding MarR family transcriptional regulator